MSRNIVYESVTPRESTIETLSWINDQSARVNRSIKGADSPGSSGTWPVAREGKKRETRPTSSVSFLIPAAFTAIVLGPRVVKLAIRP